MVHLLTFEAMQREYKQNLESYVKNHPGEFILLEMHGLSNFKTTFYCTKKELDEAIKDYHGKFGPTFFTAEIPNTMPDPEKEKKNQLMEILKRTDI